jgi:DNA repair protein RecO (recombination protein O)
MLTKDLAICIKSVEYSETSQIVTLFARTAGKLSAIAKGSKRPKSPFGGPIEIFSCGNIVFSDTGREKLATLTEFEPIPGEQGGAWLQNDLFALNCCFFAVELLGKLTEDYDPHPELFDAFLQFLQNIKNDDNKHNILALLIIFQLELLKQVGLMPNLTSQMENWKLRMVNSNTEQVQTQTLNEIERILIAHFTKILGHQPIMIKYFHRSLK